MKDKKIPEADLTNLGHQTMSINDLYCSNNERLTYLACN